MTSRKILDAARKGDFCEQILENARAIVSKVNTKEAHLRACERAVVEAAVKRDDARIAYEAADDEDGAMERFMDADDELDKAIRALREARGEKLTGREG